MPALLSRLYFDNGLYVVGPGCHCGTLLGCICRAIVDTGNAGFMAADMVDHRFNDVGLNACFRHAGDHRSSEVMKTPVLDAGSLRR